MDHLALAVPAEGLSASLLFFRSILGLQPRGVLEIPDPYGLIRSRALVNDNRSLRITLNVAQGRKTVMARAVSGAGVHHVAFACDDIFASVPRLEAAGVGFLDIPDNYYDDIEAKYDLAPELMAQLRANHILYDREGDGEFFQVSTHIFDERFFFEVVERRNYQGFGAANAAIRLAAQTREARPVAMPRA